MRRIVNSTYITVDGVVENPHLWPAIGSASNAVDIQTDLLLASDAVLMGRRTYDAFAPVWPTRSGDPYSDKINSIPKYVVSSTMRDPEWHNTTVISGDVPGEIAKLKDQPGGDIVQYGFGDVSRILLEHGLLDEIRLWVHPFLLGDGTAQDLIFRNGRLTRLRLRDTRALSNGIVILTYDVQS